MAADGVAADGVTDRPPNQAASTAERVGARLARSLEDRTNWLKTIGILAEMFPGPRELRVLLDAAGLKPSRVDMEGTAEERWYSALDEASKHSGGLEKLIAAAHQSLPYAPAWGRWA